MCIRDRYGITERLPILIVEKMGPHFAIGDTDVYKRQLYARQVGDYFLRNATGYKLPRKLKVAFSSSASDTGCATVNDMGFVGVLDGGKPMFRLWLAGGMGGQPALGIPYDELVAPEEVLYYVEAMVRLFMAEGDYTNNCLLYTSVMFWAAILVPVWR